MYRMCAGKRIFDSALHTFFDGLIIFLKKTVDISDRMVYFIIVLSTQDKRTATIQGVLG